MSALRLVASFVAGLLLGSLAQLLYDDHERSRERQEARRVHERSIAALDRVVVRPSWGSWQSAQRSLRTSKVRALICDDCGETYARRVGDKSPHFCAGER